jgi:hypothetical protein
MTCHDLSGRTRVCHRSRRTGRCHGSLGAWHRKAKRLTRLAGMPAVSREVARTIRLIIDRRARQVRLPVRPLDRGGGPATPGRAIRFPRFRLDVGPVSPAWGFMLQVPLRRAFNQNPVAGKSSDSPRSTRSFGPP